MVEELDKVSHRPYSTGFYLGGRGGQHTAGGGYVRDYEVMGVVIDSVPGRVHVSQRNKLQLDGGRFATSDLNEL